jgi:hypothetical protein
MSVFVLPGDWKLTQRGVSWREVDSFIWARGPGAAGGYFAGDVGTELAASREF